MQDFEYGIHFQRPFREAFLLCLEVVICSMARARSPNRDRAFEMWRESGGTMKLKDIAAEIGETDSKVRKWKTLDDWDGQLEQTKGSAPLPQMERSTSEERERSPSKAKRGAPTGNQNAKGHGAPLGNRNAVGNNGGAPEGNENAVTHGFFRSKLPKRLQELHKQVCEMDPVDMAWNNLTLTMTIMLDSLEQLAAERSDRQLVKKKKFAIPTDDEGVPVEIEGELLHEIEWEHHTSLDQQVKAMAALDRQQARLDNQIRKFLALADEDDKRRLELEAMRERLRMERERHEVDMKKAKGSSDDEGGSNGLDKLAEALERSAAAINGD